MIHTRILLVILAGYLTGCGTALYFKTSTDPFQKFTEKSSYRFFVLIPESATPDDKKAAKHLMEIIASLKNCMLTDNLEACDFVVLVMSSSRTYQSANTGGYLFILPFIPIGPISPGAYGVTEVSMYICTIQKFPQYKRAKLNTVWTGLLRSDKESYRAHPKTCIKNLFMRFGDSDIDRNVDIRYDSYID